MCLQQVSIYLVVNRTTEKVDRFLENEAKGTFIVGSKSIADFCAQLAKPRKIVLLVKAGSAVDDFIAALFFHFFFV